MLRLTYSVTVIVILTGCAGTGVKFNDTDVASIIKEDVWEQLRLCRKNVVCSERDTKFLAWKLEALESGDVAFYRVFDSVHRGYEDVLIQQLRDEGVSEEDLKPLIKLLDDIRNVSR